MTTPKTTRRPSHPGNFFAFNFVVGKDGGGIHTIEVLAKKMCVKEEDLLRFSHGDARCGVSLARRLADCTGTDAKFWLTMQLNIDVWLAEQIIFTNKIEKF